MQFFRPARGAALLLACAMGSAWAAPSATTKTYIVQLSEAPVASYEGGIPGLAATMPVPGARLDAQASHVKAYRSHLATQRATVMARMGSGARVLHQYELGLNGFAARMTEAEAAQLQASGLVRSVRPSRMLRADTISTPAFLGLDAPNGAWAKSGGNVRGEDVIIASIDSGVQPESPAFYDQVDANGTPVASGGTLAYGPPPARWKGTCQTGPGFPRSSCNNKLIGARVFSAGFLANANPWFGSYYDVPRDEDGHGTHTLSTAGGNANVPAIDDRGIPLGKTTGIAPRARVVAYKALFLQLIQGQRVGAGDEGDILAAIEAAIADGVDVINFSVSGAPGTMLDATDLAFLNATKAGVFVATSAGNAGPDNTVAHPNPWLTTVAASTHDRNPYARLTLGDGRVFSGASFTVTGLPSAPMVLAQNAGLAAVRPVDARQCKPGSLDPAVVAGKLVVCDRGGIVTRVEKGNAVAQAGGVGTVILNTTDTADGPLVADPQLVPTVMLGVTDGDAVRAYAASRGATGSIGPRYQVPGVIAPVMADFSSRGPNLADTNVMKPDLTGPGVNIVASFAYAQKNQLEHDLIRAGTMAVPPRWAALDGTSMSTPHIAGIAALLKQKYPTWTPDLIKSALMTTATGVKLASGSPDIDVSGFGAGHVNPNGALNPGLVFPIFTRDYTAFLCASGWYVATSTTCTAVPVIAPQDLNLPSLAGEVVGQTSFSRTVRNVTSAPMTVTATANLPGYKVSVQPPTMTVAPGRNGKFKVVVARDTAPVGQLVSGSVSWSDGSHAVTMPAQVRAVGLTAPGELLSSATTGSAALPVTYGFAGTTTTTVVGYKPALRVPMTAPSFQETCVALPSGSATTLLRAAMYYTDSNLLGSVSLSVKNNDTGDLAFGQDVGDAQMITIPALPAGNYSVCLFPFLDGFTLNTTLSLWTFNASDANGSLKVTGLPNGTVIQGQRFTGQASWSGLQADQRYLGAVSYSQPDGSLAGLTVMRVEPGAVPAGQTLSRGSSFLATRTRLKPSTKR